MTKSFCAHNSLDGDDKGNAICMECGNTFVWKDDGKGQGHFQLVALSHNHSSWNDSDRCHYCGQSLEVDF